jgi:hypothetical protein
MGDLKKSSDNIFKNMGMGDSYLNPNKALQDVGLYDNGDAQNRDFDQQRGQANAQQQAQAQTLAGQQAAQQKQASDLASKNKWQADQDKAAQINNQDLTSAMEEASQKANMAKRGNNKMFGDRLGGM